MAYDLMRGTLGGRDWSLGAARTPPPAAEISAKVKNLSSKTSTLDVAITDWYRAWKHNPTSVGKLRAVEAFFADWSRWRDGARRFASSWKDGEAYDVKAMWKFPSDLDARLQGIAEWQARFAKAAAGSPAPPPPAPHRIKSVAVPPPATMIRVKEEPKKGGGLKWLAIIGGVLGLGAIAASLGKKG